MRLQPNKRQINLGANSPQLNWYLIIPIRESRGRRDTLVNDVEIRDCKST